LQQQGKEERKRRLTLGANGCEDLFVRYFAQYQNAGLIYGIILLLIWRGPLCSEFGAVAVVSGRDPWRKTKHYAA